MNWWAVAALKDGVVHKVQICEERALADVRTQIAKTGIYDEPIQAVPAEGHWTAEIRFPTEPADVDGIEEW